MGDYTQLRLQCDIKKECKEVISILNSMIEYDYDNIPSCELTSHPVFTDSRFGLIFHCTSAYFDNECSTTFENLHLDTVFDLKNYNNTIQKFLNWLAPYIESEGQIGEYMYEYWDKPQPIIKKDNVVFLFDEPISAESLNDD